MDDGGLTMEMRWEKLYSGGLTEFRKSEWAICRPVRRAKALNVACLGTLLTVLAIGTVLIFQ
ncbi:hypothetical protein [Cupriavidus necator]|uniref:hypothetical protein n=1 Tax=Cupriavidus necator TaxID=106590 RepID=UPI0005B4E172|nr:hypothetical protein [Cupriavidus necator]